jgi:hypothetical protein
MRQKVGAGCENSTATLVGPVTSFFTYTAWQTVPLDFQIGEFCPVTACYYLASVNSTASLLIVPFEIAMSLPSGENR